MPGLEGNLKGVLGCAFLALYALFLLLLFLAMMSYFRALRLRDLKKVPLNADLIEHFQKHRYVDVLFSMTRLHIDLFVHSGRVCYRKVLWIRAGYWLTMVAMTLLPIIVLMSYWIRLQP